MMDPQISDTIRLLRARQAHAQYVRKLHMMPVQIGASGVEAVGRPVRGKMEYVAYLEAPFMHYDLLREALAAEITDDIGCVVELGCGDATVLAEIHDKDATSRVYLATDISSEALQNARKLRLATCPFSAEVADFEFIRGLGTPLLHSVFSLVYAKPFAPDFWHRLRATCPTFKALLFEPVSHRLPDIEKPLFTRKMFKAYQLSESFWDITTQAAADGVIVIEDVKPDYAGLSMLSAVSMIKIRSA